MLSMIGMWLGRSALMQSPVGPLLARFWKPLAIILAVVAVFVGHQVYAHHALKAQYKAGYAQAEKDIAARALKQKTEVDTRTHAIAANERKQNDEAVVRIDTHADAVGVRGPGLAVCPGPAAPAGGHQPRPGPVDAGLDRVPYPDWQQLLAVPFDDTVSFGRQCDINTEEVRRWHSWYGRLVTAWPKAQAPK